MRSTSLFCCLILLFGLICVAPLQAESPPESDEGWISLYNGTLDDFRIYFRDYGYIEDGQNQQVFLAEPDQIHVVEGTNGLIATKIPYSHYHVKVDYRWGEKGSSGNAGLMTHIDIHSKAIEDNRPRSIEINMLQTAPGSLLMAHRLGPFSRTFIAEDDAKNNTSFLGRMRTILATFLDEDDTESNTYLSEKEGGIPFELDPFDNKDRVVYANYPESGKPNTHPPGQWNTLEAIVRGSESIEIVLNGVTVNRAYDIRDVKEGSQNPGAPLTEGSIGLQSEKQEIFYRNFMLKKLEP